MCYRVEGIRSSNNNRSRSLSRAAAETRCRDLKGHLASIRTQEEQTCLIGYLAHVNEPMWIGLYELQLPDSKYSWKWEDESFSFEAASYANWDAGKRLFSGKRKRSKLEFSSRASLQLRFAARLTLVMKTSNTFVGVTKG